MTKPARFSYAVLAATLVLVGCCAGAPFLALLFPPYFVLRKLSRFIPNKWLTLALFIVVVAGIAYTAGHFTRAAIVALPKIADKSIPAIITWFQAQDINLPFTDFESLKAHTMESIKDRRITLVTSPTSRATPPPHLSLSLSPLSPRSAFFLTASSISSANRTNCGTIFTRSVATRSPRASASFIAVSPP